VTGNATFVGDLEAANLSGDNTGDQVADGTTITGAGTLADPFVASVPDLSVCLYIDQTDPQTITGDTPILDALKNKGTIGTDANGKIVAGSVGTYTRTLQMFGDMRGLYIVSADWILLNMDRAASTYPSGVTITRVYVDCSTASPTTQLTGKLKYCDALGGGAFPGASPTDIVTLTTTTGNYDSGAISTSVGANKIIYLEMTADPTDYNTTWNICVSYTVN